MDVRGVLYLPVSPERHDLAVWNHDAAKGDEGCDD
jgi:hypothetical protein